MPYSPSITRPFHDWETLSGKLKFIYDLRIPKGQAQGLYERKGEYSAWLIRQGTATVEAEGRKVEAALGDWLFCFADLLHQQFAPDTRLLSVRIENHWPQAEPFFQGPPLLLLKSPDYPMLEQLAMEMRRQVNIRSWSTDVPAFVFSWKTHVSYPSFLRHQRQLIQWKEQISEILVSHGYRLNVPNGVDPRLAHALNAVESTGFVEAFSGAAIARESGLTIRQLNRLCVQTYGLTIQAYWEQRRIEHAQQMLAAGGISVKMVASSLGFSQLSNFSAWFKQKAGVPPRAYLKEIDR